MRTSFSLSLVAVIALFPTFVTAQATADSVLGTISGVLNGLIGLFITIALIVFFWGLIKYLAGSGQEGNAEGLKIMFWGAITLFVMVSIWGIIKLVQNTFDVADQSIKGPGGFQYEAPGEEARQRGRP